MRLGANRHIYTRRLDLLDFIQAGRSNQDPNYPKFRSFCQVFSQILSLPFSRVIIFLPQQEPTGDKQTENSEDTFQPKKVF